MAYEEKQETVGTASVKKPMSSLVVNNAQDLSVKAEAIADRLRNKLESVMTQPVPDVAYGENIGKQPEEYPPLFNLLSSSLNLIRKALNQIDYDLSRTEL